MCHILFFSQTRLNVVKWKTIRSALQRHLWLAFTSAEKYAKTCMLLVYGSCLD